MHKKDIAKLFKNRLDNIDISFNDFKTNVFTILSDVAGNPREGVSLNTIKPSLEYMGHNQLSSVVEYKGKQGLIYQYCCEQEIFAIAEEDNRVGVAGIFYSREEYPSMLSKLKKLYAPLQKMYPDVDISLNNVSCTSAIGSDIWAYVFIEKEKLDKTLIRNVEAYLFNVMDESVIKKYLLGTKSTRELNTDVMSL